MSEIEKLYELASKTKMSDAEKDEQRRSFVFGSTKIENDRITRELVDEVADRLTKK